MHRRLPFVLLLLVLLIAAAWFLARGSFLNWAFPATLSGSGVIESDEDTVATESAGRVVALDAEEGDTVRAGRAMGRLDAALLSTQVEQAEAALGLAQAALAKAQAGARPEELAQQQAVLTQGLARRDGARVALEDARAARDRPQDLNARINAARGALAVSEHRALAANGMAQAATLEREYFQRTLAAVENGIHIEIQTPRGLVTRDINVRTEDLRSQLALAVSKEWGAWAAQNTAFAQRDAAQSDLNQLLDLQADPLALNAQVNAASAALETAEAAVQVAQAKLDSLKAGTRAESMAAARALVAQAQAARDGLKAQWNKMTLSAPRDGVVSRRLLHLGEMAAAGSAIYRITNLDTVTLTIYIPESRIGSVRVGATARVTVDAFPGRVFQGQVVFVSPQAEFTPRNVVTQDQRATQVFAVKIQIDNRADHALKPGMPADGVIEP